MAVLPVTEGISIDDAELQESFVRSSGPGGQNVNKVATAVELRFDVKGSANLPEWLRERLLQRRDRRITQDGVFVLSGQRFRTQDRNRQDVRERLLQWIQQATITQAPRIATKPSRGAKRARLQSKNARGEVKKMRAKVRDDD